MKVADLEISRVYKEKNMNNVESIRKCSFLEFRTLSIV